MDPKNLNEAEICDAFITPAITRAGWEQSTQMQIGLDELGQQYRAWKGLDEASDKLARQPYADLAGKKPRYYQRVAIQRAVEAIARGQRRVLLVMATGTGKTFSVFQIIWRLWKAEKVNGYCSSWTGISSRTRPRPTTSSLLVR